MAITRKTWFSSQHRSRTLFVVLSLVISSIWVNPSLASRGGIEDRSNTFAVAMTYKDNNQPQLCSGVMISPTVIATAAHCVESHHNGALTDYTFSNPGADVEDPVTPNSVMRVVKTGEDLAFILINVPLSGGKSIPIADPLAISELKEKSPLFGYGFGAVFEEFTLYSRYARKYPIEWLRNIPVAGTPNTYEVVSASSSACSGDSGGPVTALIGGKEVLIGVMGSAAQVEGNCGTKGEDGLFRMKIALIHSYVSLIPAPIANPSNSPSPISSISQIPLAKKRIICVKGKKQIIVRAVKPKCPPGYRLKR